MIGKFFGVLESLNDLADKFVAATLRGKSKESFLAYVEYRRYWRQKNREVGRHYAIVRELQDEYYDTFLISDWFSGIDKEKARELPEYFLHAFNGSKLAESHAFEHFLLTKRSMYANSPEHLAALDTLEKARSSLP